MGLSMLKLGTFMDVWTVQTKDAMGRNKLPGKEGTEGKSGE